MTVKLIGNDTVRRFSW